MNNKEAVIRTHYLTLISLNILKNLSHDKKLLQDRFPVPGEE